MGRLVFRDFDAFAEAITGMHGRFIPTARSTSEWWLESSSVGQSCLQKIQIGSAATFAGDGEHGMLTCVAPLTESAQIRIDGHFLEPDAFLVLREDQPFTFTGQDVVRWTGVTVPTNSDLIAPELLAAARAGPCPRLRTALPYLARLRRVTERAISASIDFEESAVIAAAEEEVALCLTHVLERSVRASNRHIGRPQVSRGRVIARVLSLIEASEGQPLSVEDLCRAAEVSERSLRNIFLEFFGVGPMRLLKVRQLREVRAALLRADSQRETVVRVAARYGVWDFCQFARNYKALFGESPSRTLRTPPSERSIKPCLSWLHYASRIFIEGGRDSGCDLLVPESASDPDLDPVDDLRCAPSRA